MISNILVCDKSIVHQSISAFRKQHDMIEEIINLRRRLQQTDEYTVPKLESANVQSD